MKNKKIKIFYIIVIVLALCNFFILYNTYSIKTITIDIKSNKINSSVTFVQLSDLHGQVFDKNNQSIIKRIKELSPDFVLITGDMYTKNDLKGQKVAIQLIKDISKDFPIYFVSGEHDNNDNYIEQLKSLKVNVLNYKKQTINIRNNILQLYGIDNAYYSDTFSLNNYFSLNSHYYNILLAHIPNLEAFAEFEVDLVLSGDSHGGVIRLPGIGSLKYQDVWFPKFKHIEYYDKGLYCKNKTLMYVSAGLGNYRFPIRLFNRPEITFFRLIPNN